MGTKIKKISIGILAFVCVFMLSACGGEKSEETYKVVMEPTFPPFDITNDSGEVDGFDKELLEAVAKDQGFKISWETLEFDALIPAITSKQADIIASGMNALDPARQKKVAFSDTYYDSGLVILVKNDSSITGIGDFTAEMNVAGQIGTTGADKANELAKSGKIAKAVILNKNSEAIMQLQNGDISAFIIDKPVAENYIKKQGDKLKIVGETMNAESYGFAVNKENKELLKKINEGLKNLKENGEYDKIYKKWF